MCLYPDAYYINMPLFLILYVAIVFYSSNSPKELTGPQGMAYFADSNSLRKRVSFSENMRRSLT